MKANTAGIQCVESVTYTVGDLDESARFLTDLGLSPGDRDADGAEFRTLAGQTFRIIRSAPDWFPPPPEDDPTIREIVWGVDTEESLERLLAAVATDRPVTERDGVHHFVDDSGFHIGLTLTRTVDPVPRDVPATNSWGRIERWNSPVTAASPVKPVRICHVALNTVKADYDQQVAFYTDRLEFVPRDIVKPVGTFLQAPGDDDQHNFLLAHRPDKTGANHVSFEVPGFDDVIEGGNHMIGQGWREARRLGRHVVGSNVFRFIHAPFGGRVELAFDMDRVDDTYGTRVHEESPGHHVWTMKVGRDPVQEGHGR